MSQILLQSTSNSTHHPSHQAVFGGGGNTHENVLKSFATEGEF